MKLRNKVSFHGGEGKAIYTRRVKSGLVVTESHLKRIDENLRRAKASSRNDFVEQAIEFYIGYLNAEDSSQYIGELLSAELDRRVSHFTKTFGTNQYKTFVQLAGISHVLASAFDFSREYVDSLFRQCQQEVKQLDSVPNFARISVKKNYPISSKGNHYMDTNEHREIQSFLKTGIGGSYEFSNPTVSRTQLGKMFPYFDDVEITVDSKGSKISREMCIDGKVFHVCSIFPMYGRRKENTNKTTDKVHG